MVRVDKNAKLMAWQYLGITLFMASERESIYNLKVPIYTLSWPLNNGNAQHQKHLTFYNPLNFCLSVLMAIF